MDINKYNRIRSRFFWFLLFGWILYTLVMIVIFGANVLGGEDFFPGFMIATSTWLLTHLGVIVCLLSIDYPRPFARAVDDVF